MPTACSTPRQGNTITSDPAKPARPTGALMRLARERFATYWRWFVAGTLCAALTSIAAASYGYLLKLVVEGLEALAGPWSARSRSMA